jgi:hypothetical protein
MSIPHVYGHLDMSDQTKDYKTGIYCFSLSEEKEQRLIGYESG